MAETAVRVFGAKNMFLAADRTAVTAARAVM
jgi:hypothetical protein